MQKILYFGSNDEKKTPWSEGFEMQADGSINFIISALNKFEIEDGKNIDWGYLFNSQIDNLATPDEIFNAQESEPGYGQFAVYDKYQFRLWNKLEKYCGSESERDFFNLYTNLCFNSSCNWGYNEPALIPQVYINWFFTQNERDKNKKQKPFIVDFVFKSSRFGTDNLVIVEIDGKSHYANYNNSNRTYALSEEMYAEHLKKDRWLRNQGFKVFRIGNSEIKNITSLPERKQPEAFFDFFEEIFGISIYPES